MSDRERGPPNPHSCPRMTVKEDRDHSLLLYSEIISVEENKRMQINNPSGPCLGPNGPGPHGLGSSGPGPTEPDPSRALIGWALEGRAQMGLPWALSGVGPALTSLPEPYLGRVRSGRALMETSWAFPGPQWKVSHGPSLGLGLPLSLMRRARP